jgi:microcystin-dependent protein
MLSETKIFGSIFSSHILNIMKYSLSIFFLLIFLQGSYAQIGINNSNPDDNSVLDLKATNKGLLIPRLSTTQREAMSTGTGFSQGMMVYDITLDILFVGYGNGASANTKWYAMNSWKTEYSSYNNADTAHMTAMTTTGVKHGNVGIGVSVPTKKLEVDGWVKSTGFIGYGATPIGGIIMWSGSTVPDGWTLCNGVTNNGITPPNLSGRFVVGIGSNRTTSYSHANKGGLDAVTLSASQMPQHNHTFTTSSNGNHTHQIERLPYDGMGSGIDMMSMTGSSNWDEAWTGVDTRGRGASISTNGNHNHSGTTANKGSSTAHENRPAYYAIAYIMRVK